LPFWIRIARRSLSRVVDRTVGLLPLVGVVASIAWVVAWGADDWAASLRSATLSAAMVWQHPIAAVAVLQVAYFAFQTVLWLRYRPVPLAQGPDLPSVTVVIPAYNEGPMVERSIASVVYGDYPRDRLEVVVVDDGSRDDTFFHIERLRREYPSVVRVIRFAGNCGKRAGLAAGFRAARGEIVVTIDSDSEIEPATLRAMVAPFRDPRVGAVAGKVTVLNRANLIGAMLDVQYTLAFDFGRAAQSSIRTVACCPGALSAFRRDVILPHLEEWLGQTFFGRPVAHGEDQALTNVVLCQGYDTVYQSNAAIRTLAPVRYRQLSRMFLRWERSYVVEGFSFARFMLTRYRSRNRVLPALNFIVSNLRLVLLYVGLVQVPFMILERPQRLSDFLAATIVSATFAALYYVRRERSLRFVYGVAYAFYWLLLLQWILPWAVVTARDERWGTR